MDWGRPLRGPQQLPSHIVKGLRDLFAGRDTVIAVYEHEDEDGDYRYWPMHPESEVQELFRDNPQYHVVGFVHLDTGTISPIWSTPTVVVEEPKMKYSLWEEDIKPVLKTLAWMLGILLGAMAMLFGAGLRGMNKGSKYNS